MVESEVHSKDGWTEERFTLSFTGPNIDESTEFVCVDHAIPEDTVKQIARSYIVSE